MKIFFDLDGTLINSKPRLYNLFQHLVPQSNFSYEDYWSLKSNKISHKQILSEYFNYDLNALIAFEKEWMIKIEHKDWLKYDLPFNGVIEFLERIKSKHNLFVVTARQFTLTTETQINNLGFKDIFDDVFVTNQNKEKHELIKKSIIINQSDWFVGDTGKDIQAGKKLGLKTAAVLSGFLNRSVLDTYNPDIIVPSILELPF